MPVLYHISEPQRAVREVAVTPRSCKQPNNGWVFRAGGNFCCPSSAAVPKCHGVMESRLRAPTCSHMYRYTYILCLSSFLTLCLFLSYLSFSGSDSNTCQHRSTGHDLLLTTTQNKKMESEPEAEWQFYSADAEIFGAFLLHPRDVRILLVS